MTRNQVTWLLGKEGNKINQQNANTNVVNAETNRASHQLAQEESNYNKSSNVWGNVVSVITSLATVLLAILL